MAKKKNLSMVIEVYGDTCGDLEQAFEEALKRFKHGGIRGSGSNDTGGFSFEMKEISR